MEVLDENDLTIDHQCLVLHQTLPKILPWRREIKDHMKIFSHLPDEIVVVVCEILFVFQQLFTLRFNDLVQIYFPSFLLSFIFFLNDDCMTILARLQSGRILSFKSTFLYPNRRKNLNKIVAIKAVNHLGTAHDWLDVFIPKLVSYSELVDDPTELPLILNGFYYFCPDVIQPVYISVVSMNLYLSVFSAANEWWKLQQRAYAISFQTHYNQMAILHGDDSENLE